METTNQKPHWIMKYPSRTTGRSTDFSCSVCGFSDRLLATQGTTWDVWRAGYHYCPKCGVKMIVPEKPIWQLTHTARSKASPATCQSMKMLRKIVRELVDEYLDEKASS